MLFCFFKHVVAQVVIWRSPTAGLSHFSIFWGFIVLFIGTCIVAVEEYGSALLGDGPLFFYGSFYLVVSLALEIFGLLFLGGLILALIRRRADPRFKPLSRPIDSAILWLFLVIGASGFIVEGCRIAAANGGPGVNDFEAWSFVGWGIARLLGGLDEGLVRGLHLGLWMLHMVLSMAFIAAIPYCKLRHILFAPLNIALEPPRTRGKYSTVSMEEVEESGRYGVGALEHFTRRQLASFDACTQCARCQTSCPAWATDKPLSLIHI